MPSRPPSGPQSRLGATVDFASFTFPGDPEGNLLGIPPSDFFHQVLHFLRDHGLDRISYTPRPTGVYNYTVSHQLHRPSEGSERALAIGLAAYSLDAHNRTASGSSRPGKNNTGFYLSLSGAGCQGVDFPALIHAYRDFGIHVTRVDFAIDYFDGHLDFPAVEHLYQTGKFITGNGRTPRYTTIKPEQSGKRASGYTVYIGKRGGAKMVRGYEKAPQLVEVEKIDFNPFYKWFRLEFEFRANKCEIPVECFENPDGLLRTAYPKLFPELPIPTHIEEGHTTDDLLRLNFRSPPSTVNADHLLQHANRSYGAFFRVLRDELDYSPDEILDRLTEGQDNRVPSRLLIPAFTQPKPEVINS